MTFLLPFLIVAVAALPRTKLVQPKPTVLLTDRHGRFLGEIPEVRDGELGYWPLRSLPHRVAAAAIAVEDRSFDKHPGVNPLAIFRAAYQNIREGRIVSGGSTIAMQVARMQDPGPRTWSRKTVEAVTAIYLTLRYGRDAVIRQYLTIVPYGNRIRGIAYAARRYLDKPVEDLSWAEVAFLAAIPQAPDRMNPYHLEGRRRAVRRGGRILDLLYARGDLSKIEYTTAKEQLANLRITRLSTRPLSALHAILQLEARVIQEREKGTLPDPPILRTTLDLKIQQEVAWRTLDAIDHFQDKGVGNAAVLVLDRETSKVRAWIGSADYFDEDRAGAIDYADTGRHTGSTLKPFFYAWALDRGLIDTGTVLDDIMRGPNGVENSDHRFLGPMLPRFALANSRNVPVTRLVEKLGLEEGYAFLGELGFHDGSLPAEHFGLGIALGGLPVSLAELVQGYTALANDGRQREFVWYEGQVTAPPKRVVSEEAARLITLYLSDPMARLPSFPRMGASEFPFPVAVKTGTSSSFRDAWTIAWSAKYIVGVWFGHPDYLPMNRVSGYKAAAPLAKAVLEYLHPENLEGLEDLSFPPPRGYVGERVCSVSGKLPGAACDRVHLEWFAPGEQPVSHCDVHLFMAFDRRTGRLADANTSTGFVEIKPVVKLPARYASWLGSTGYGSPVPPTENPLLPLWTDQPELSGMAAPVLRILDPNNGDMLMIDPELPRKMVTIGLVAEVEPSPEQVLWYVDGVPFETADYPYTVRWPLKGGEHSFQVGIPHTSYMSRPVRITVQ